MTSGRLFRLIFALVPILAAVSTVSAQSYTFGQLTFPTGTGPTSMAAGDFDGDGKLDLAVANRGDNTVSVYLGKQNGTFALPVNYATGPQPSSVAVGDFNGDGNLDLVVTNENCVIIGHISVLQCGSASVSVLLGNGDGTFQLQQQFPTALRPLSIKTADLNGDGKLDLVIAGSRGNTPVSVLLGNGDGTFQDHVDYSPPTPTGGATWLVVGDFNGDGKPDIAANAGSGVAIYLGVGDGTLQAPTTFQLHDPAGGNSGAAVGDFNSDGKLDLAVSTGPGVDVFLGNGDGTFAFQAVFPGVSGQIAAVDMNQDGKLDLVGTSSDVHGNGFFISSLIGNGNGTFQLPVSQATGMFPSALAAGDFNGDGLVDIAVAVVNSPDSEPQQGAPVPATGPFGSITVFLGVENGALGFRPMTTTVTVTSSTNFLPASMRTADLNGDTKLDLAFLNSGGSTVSVLLGNGDGTFQTQHDFATGTLPVALQVADLNGDGKPDLVVVNQVCLFSATSCTAGSVSVLLGNGDGTFQAHVDYPVGVTPMSLVVADFNGDGKPDLAVTNANLGLGNTISILTGKGDGTFNPHVDQMVVPEPGPIVAADFNRDGKIDLAVGCADVANTNACPGVISFSILLGNGDATFQRHDFLSNSPVFPHGPYSMAVGDFNADGNPDLAIGGFSGSFAVFLGKGDGTFQAGGSGQDLNTGKESLAIGDFDADGKLDVALPQDTPRVVLFHGNGDGNFQSAQQLFLAGDLTFDDPVPVSGDFNGNSSEDLAVLESGSNTLSMILNNPFKSVFPSFLAFGSQGVGTSSSVRTITIGNPSVTPFRISSIAASGPYSETNNCSATVLPGETCTINVTFMPVTATAGNGAIMLTDSTHNSPQVIALTGTGVNGPFLEFSLAHLTFASTSLGSTSAARTVTLTNTGNATLTVANLAITGANAGDFHESNTCGSNLAPAATCSVSVTFAPTAGGTRLAALTITDAASGSPHSVILSAITLSPQPTLSATALTFGGQNVGSASSPQTVTLTNTGNSALSVSQIATSGDFAESNNCGSSVAAGGSCQISVTFTPTATGNRSGSLTVTDGASSSPQSVALTGTGEDFTMSAGAPISATVTSGQTATYSVSLAADGGFSADVSLTCSGNPTGSTCTISPAMVSVSGTSSASATVTVTTTARSFLTPPRGNGTRNRIERPLELLLAGLVVILMLVWIYRTRTYQRLRWRAALVLVLLSVAITLASCGGGNSSTGGSGGLTGTQPGTYTITVTASATAGSTTLAHSTKLTLVVQ